MGRRANRTPIQTARTTGRGALGRHRSGRRGGKLTSSPPLKGWDSRRRRMSPTEVDLSRVGITIVDDTARGTDPLSYHETLSALWAAERTAPGTGLRAETFRHFAVGRSVRKRFVGARTRGGPSRAGQRHVHRCGRGPLRSHRRGVGNPRRGRSTGRLRSPQTRAPVTCATMPWRHQGWTPQAPALRTR